jgi:hypothetical protein
MADLKVSYDKLEQSAKNLDAVKGELDDTSAHQADIKGILGSGDVAHAMDDFANNWSYHRDTLKSKVEELGEMCEEAYTQFSGGDSKLGSDLKGSGKK